MRPLRLAGSVTRAAVALPDDSQKGPDFGHTFSTLRLAVKPAEQGRHRGDATGGDFVDLPFR
jgi:hypothetical protein